MAWHPWVRNELHPDVWTAVYRLYSAAGELLYVGIAYDFVSRFKDHAKKDWWPEVAHRDVTWFETRLDAMYEEARAIRDESPRYNIAEGISLFGWIAFRNSRGLIDEPQMDIGRDLLLPRFHHVLGDGAHALLAAEGELKGVMVPWDWYLRACEAMGESPADVEVSLAPAG